MKVDKMGSVLAEKEYLLSPVWATVTQFSDRLTHLGTPVRKWVRNCVGPGAEKAPGARTRTSSRRGYASSWWHSRQSSSEFSRE